MLRSWPHTAVSHWLFFFPLQTYFFKCVIVIVRVGGGNMFLLTFTLTVSKRAAAFSTSWSQRLLETNNDNKVLCSLGLHSLKQSRLLLCLRSRQACSSISSVVGIGLYLSFLLMPRTEKQYGLARFMLLVVSEPSAIESGSRVTEVHRIENCSHRLQPF